MKNLLIDSDISRLKEVLDSDRLLITSQSIELINVDLKNVLGHYFILSSTPNLNIVKKNDEFFIDIQVKAKTIRPFGVIPQKKF